MNRYHLALAAAIGILLAHLLTLTVHHIPGTGLHLR